MAGGPVPEGMVKASEPKYSVGSDVMLTVSHMRGMKGAKATIASFADETVYVSMTPLTA